MDPSVPPEQVLMFVPVMDTGEYTGIVSVNVIAHKLLSVTVTVYVPAVNPVAVEEAGLRCQPGFSF